LAGNRNTPLVDERPRWSLVPLAGIVGEDTRELVDVSEQVGHRPIGAWGVVVELVVTYAGN
jgi:hypothetical protein